MFTNSQNLTTWSGTATVTNESDFGAVLDTFTYTLQDTGTAVGVGGPVGGPIHDGGVPEWAADRLQLFPAAVAADDCEQDRSA